MITLVKDTIDFEDVTSLIEWLKTNPILTKNKLTIEFENKWSEWLGRKYSVYVNSGSSANLAMTYLLKETDQLKNDKIVFPTLCWSTTIAPAIQFGFKPILCDIEEKSLSIDLNHLEDICKRKNPAAVFYINPIGFMGDMDGLMNLSDRYGFELIEDSCETVGSTYKGKKAGNFGLMSSFSFFFGHPLSSIEGGMICTDDERIRDLLLMIRSHGWDRDLNKTAQKRMRELFQVDDFSAFYTFYIPGFNIRATDLQAYLGILQLDKIEKMIDNRRKSYEFYRETIKNDEWNPDPFCELVSCFGYPVIHSKRDQIVKKLIKKEVECRPLIAGSIAHHPLYNSRFKVDEDLPFGEKAHKYGLYIPCNDKLTLEEMTYISDIINEEMSK